MPLILAVGAGLLAALPQIVAMSTPAGLFLGLLSPLPLFLAGLGLGWSSAAIGGAVTVLVLGLAGGLNAALGAIVVLAAPLALLTRQALLARPGASGTTEWYPAGSLVGWLLVIGAVWLMAAGLLLAGDGGIEAGVVERLRAQLTLMLPSANADQIAEVASVVAPIALASGVDTWLLVLALNGVLAQGALARFGRSIRPAAQPASIKLPRWVIPALAAALAGALFLPGDLGYMASNLGAVLVLAFFFAGLAAAHNFAARHRAKGIILTVLYFAVLVFGWPAVLVIGYGLIEQAISLTRRSGSANGQEEE